MPLDNRFSFHKDIEEKIDNWKSTVEVECLKEPIMDLTGDTFYEIRKMEQGVLSIIEEAIISGRYKGFKDGVEFSEEEVNSIKEGKIIEEDLKNAVKKILNKCWQSMLNKQKVGIDKLIITMIKK
jgi:hypothetical protein